MAAGSSELVIFALAHRLQRQAVGADEREHVLVEASAASLRVGRRARRRGVSSRSHVELEVLLEVLLQARQLERAAEGDDLLDARVAVDRGVEADRPLDLRDEVGEHRPHRLEDLPGVLAGGGVALEVLGLLEAELELLTSASVKLLPPIGIERIQTVLAVGDDQVGVLGAEVDDHRRAA